MTSNYNGGSPIQPSNKGVACLILLVNFIKHLYIEPYPPSDNLLVVFSPLDYCYDIFTLSLACQVYIGLMLRIDLRLPFDCDYTEPGTLLFGIFPWVKGSKYQLVPAIR
jgi:hypothetical protein